MTRLIVGKHQILYGPHLILLITLFLTTPLPALPLLHSMLPPLPLFYHHSTILPSLHSTTTSLSSPLSRFSAPGYPANLPVHWDERWGYLFKPTLTPNMWVFLCSVRAVIGSVVGVRVTMFSLFFFSSFFFLLSSSSTLLMLYLSRPF